MKHLYRRYLEGRGEVLTGTLKNAESQSQEAGANNRSKSPTNEAGRWI
jgi:hypothetical protein